MARSKERKTVAKPNILINGIKGDTDRKVVSAFSECEDWITQTSENSASKEHRRNSSRDILVRLYSIWQPQNSESYRPSAVEMARPRTRTRENSRNNRGAKKESREGKESRNGRDSSRSKLRIIESVVETINHLQKKHRTASESTSPSSSVITSKARDQFKKSIQQALKTPNAET